MHLRSVFAFVALYPLLVAFPVSADPMDAVDTRASDSITLSEIDARDLLIDVESASGRVGAEPDEAIPNDRPRRVGDGFVSIGRIKKTPDTNERPRTRRDDDEPRQTRPRRDDEQEEARPRRRDDTTQPRPREDVTEAQPRRRDDTTETRPRRRDETRRDRPRPRDEDRNEKADSSGTGFYVSIDGKILTNYHVVQQCKRMMVDGKTDAAVIAEDRENDLAILDHDLKREEEGIALFNAASPRLNSDITVIGYPLHGLLGGVNVTRGVVSSLKGLRGDETFIQISAEVQPGNSGGPVLNGSGYIVGVVQSKLDSLRLSKITGDIPQNVNFAIRADIALSFLEDNGVTPRKGRARAPLAPADLADAAQKFTVLLECYK